MIPSTATRTPPTKPGWYWVWCHEGEDPFVLGVFDRYGKLEVGDCCPETMVEFVESNARAGRTCSWLEVAPPDARVFRPLPEEASGPLPDPLF